MCKEGNAIDEFQVRFDLEDVWGGCPICGKNDGCRSIGPTHWYYCCEHKMKWCVGINLFSCWKDMSDEEFGENYEYLIDFIEVKIGEID